VTFLRSYRRGRRAQPPPPGCQYRHQPAEPTRDAHEVPIAVAGTRRRWYTRMTLIRDSCAAPARRKSPPAEPTRYAHDVLIIGAGTPPASAGGGHPIQLAGGDFHPTPTTLCVPARA
jgi:hypothetical protein